MKKLIKTITLISAMALVSASALAAAPWSPQQQHRRHQVRKLDRRIANQQHRAANALWNGNIGGAMRHAARAQNMADRQHHIVRKMHRSNRQWERNHVYCHHGYC